MERKKRPLGTAAIFGVTEVKPKNRGKMFQGSILALSAGYDAVLSKEMRKEEIS